MRATILMMAALAAAPLAAPVAALGQPALLHSDPGQGETTRGPPTAVRLRFNQPMRLDRLQLFDSDGVEQTVRRSREAASPALEQRGGLVRLRPGEYRVDWAASSASGQAIGGTLTFRAAERRE